MKPYLDRHSGTNIYSEDSLFDPIWEVRPPSRAESYYQFWSGVEHGMKGYCVNIAYDDRQIQNGIIFDTSGHGGTDSLVRSQDRTCITIQMCGNQNPLTSHNNIFPFVYVPADSQYECLTYRYLTLPPGFKQMFPTFRSIITEELAPIALTLSQLNWKGAVSWHRRDSASFSLSLLPVKNVSATSLSLVTDPDSMTYVDFGIFKNPTDSNAIFVSALNRRLYSDAEDTLTTDFRTISFQVDSSKFDTTFRKYNLWKITDVAGQLPDTVIPSSGTYSFTVKPGQGKLFRIGPAIGLPLGEMSSNLYNNARHVTPMEEDTLSFAAVYERNGAIEVSYPHETPGSTTTKRIAGTPIDTKIDTVAFNPTPAIAFQAANKKIGIVYQDRVSAGDSDLVTIYYKRASFTNKTSFSTRKAIATFKAKKNFAATPAIAPHSNSSYNFWISWRDPKNGGSLAILDASDNLLATTTFFDHDPTKTEFVTIATHTLASDSVYIAAEEENQIYFGTAWYDAGAVVIDKSPDINISGLHPFCYHHHPEITVTKNKHVAVVWEANNGGGTAPATNNYSIYRERDGTGAWSNYTTIQVLKIPLGLGPDDFPLYPTVQYSNDRNTPLLDPFGYDVSPIWLDKKRIMWNNPLTQAAGVARFVFELNDGFRRNLYSLLAPSVEPSVPILSVGDSVVHPVLFRSPTVHEGSSFYDANITQYDFPICGVTTHLNPFTSVILKPSSVGCIGIKWKVNPPAIQRVDTSKPNTIVVLDMGQNAVSPYPDSLNRAIVWSDSILRTNNFALGLNDTIRYDRYARAGDYNAGDTASLETGLFDTSDYVKVRILLSDAVTHSIVKVLDSGILTSHGYMQTVNADSSIQQTFVSPTNYTDSLYISMEADRKSAFNLFAIGCDMLYNDTLVFTPRTPGAAYKKAEPQSPTSSNPSNGSLLTVQVIPNPFQTMALVSIDAPKDIPLNVTLFDELGRKITELANGVSVQSHSEFTITSQSLSSGFYFLRVQSGSQVVTRKVQLLK